jgi:TonB family protein
MDLSLDWILKATVLLAAAWLAVICLRSQSAALRHRIWALGLASLLATPLIDAVLPSWHARVIPAPAGWAGPTVKSQGLRITVTGSSTRRDRDLPWPVIIWASGASLMLLRLLLGSLLIRRRARPLTDVDFRILLGNLAAHYEIRQPVRLLEFKNSPDAMPVTWGILRPSIVLPSAAAAWSSERCRIVLSHELAHIGRRDWAWLICAEIVKSLYWFHPLTWVAARGLRRESEVACDDAVITSGVTAPDYASQILDLSRILKPSGWLCSTALAMAHRSDLERRFTSMLNPFLNRRGVSRKAQLITTLALTALLIPLATFRAPAQGQAAKLTGTVYDPTGAVVASATVILVNPQVHYQTTARTDAAGNFSFTGFPAGAYEVQVRQPGFQLFTNSSVILNAGQETSLGVKLSIGQVTENVDVIANGVPPAAATRSTQPTRIRVGGNVQATRILSMVKPTYPEAAQTAGIQGAVVLEAIISKDGSLTSIKVLNSVDPALDQAALAAVRQWRYQPTLLNGEPVEVITSITINFRLP